MRCKHQWADLYQKPNAESGFIQVYKARELDAFKKCESCGAIGKRNKEGSILQLPRPKWNFHLIQSAQWTENLRTFAAAQEQAK